MPTSTIAGRYRIEREIGRGGMGAVWLARDERLDRAVAIKQVGLMPGETVTDAARALREARSSAALNHANIVAVYDAIEESDRIWLVMEYVEGRTLAELSAAEGPLPPERVARLGAQVADGLATLHAAGTVHRDVKPGNVLVTDRDVAKVSDFGIARTAGDTQLTHSGMMTGTPLYFAPELARGEEPGPAADVWALGATLYAAVEGRPPYPDRPNALALLATIAERPPSRPERAGALTEPLSRMLDPDPVSRWQMADCAHALHRLAEQMDPASRTTPVAPVPTVPAESREPADPTEPGEQPRRRRGGLAAVLVGLLLLAGLVVGAILLLGPQDEPADQPVSDEPRERSSSAKPTPTAEEPTPTASSSPSETQEAPAQSTSGDPEAFASDYYAGLPDDTETSWDLLTADYQRETGGYGDYESFWNSIDEVSVDDVERADADSVDVTLTYTTDGDSQSEVRRLDLVRDGDGYLISGSEIVG